MSAVFDVLLAVLVLALAARLLFARDSFEAVVLFVAFGLAMSLVWVRLGAVDVALAEAALGAGVTGALLVNTLRRLQRGAPAWLEPPPRTAIAHVLGAICGVAAAALMARSLLAPQAAAPLGERIVQHMPGTAVSNPVTAVLLDFRAYDTLLEMAVLVAASVGVWALDRGRPAVPAPATARQEPVLAALVGRIVPLIVIAAVYLAWRGASAPGGAFQAGALLAGAGVLLLAAGFARPYSPGSVVLRIAVAAGLFVFAGIAVHTALAYGGMLRYASASAYAWILGIEAVLTVSIAAILTDLFVDVPATEGAGDVD